MKPVDEIEKKYRHYAQIIYKYLLSLTRDSDLAEELTQETFYQAIRTSDKYDESCALSTWLCAIAKNVLLTYRRKHPPLEDIEEQVIPTRSAESDALDAMGRMELLKTLHALPEPYREIMYLRVFGGLSFREIGEVQGKTENWARVTFYRGKEKLRDTLLPAENGKTAENGETNENKLPTKKGTD